MEKTVYRINRDDRRLFVKLLIPVLIENIINALFGIMDSAMLGKVDNAAQAIASVGIVSSTINLCVCFMLSFTVGITVKISQSYGAENMKDCRRITAQNLPVVTLMGLVIAAVVYIIAPYIVMFLGAKSELTADAVSYLRIVSIGFFPQAAVIAITAAYRGVGQTRIPMVYNLSAGLLNVILNYILINGKCGFPALRVAGAAYATTAAKFIVFFAAILILFFVRSPIRIGLKDFFRGRDMIMPSVKLGLSAGTEQILIQGGDIITTAIVAVVTTASFAAYQVSLSIESSLWAISGAFCVAATSLSGMAMGQKNREKIKAVVKFVWCVGFAAAILIAAFFFFFSDTLANLYTNDAEVAKIAAGMMSVCCCKILGIMTHQIIAGGMRGMGHPVYPLVSSLISLWLCRVLGCFIAFRIFHADILWVFILLLADQCLRAVLNLIFYRRLNRKCST